MRTLHFALLAVALLISPAHTMAHGSGVSYEERVGVYTVDIGYSSAAPEVGESTTFNFELLEEEKSADFSNVWVKIDSDSGETIFAGGLHNAEFGGPRMSYTFPSTGVYTISANYSDDSSVVATSSFPLTVVEGKSVAKKSFPPEVMAVVTGVVGALLGIFATLLYRKVGVKKQASKT